VRNEAAEDRYLKRVLDNAALFCDEIVVLDDCSTDDTAAICRTHPKVSTVESTHAVDGWWGGGASQSERTARETLWELACSHAGPEGWVYVFDADHELLGIEPGDFRTLLEAEGVDAWACPLWDCWDSDELQRVDGFWQAWHHQRAWLFRARLSSEWNQRDIHVGHAPPGPWQTGLMPFGAGIRHLGYVRKEHRLRKMEKYLSLAHD
jgi:GT2 family glycosyltransferase